MGDPRSGAARVVRSIGLCAALILAGVGPAVAQRQDYVFLRTDNVAENRIAYLLTLLGSDAGVRAALAKEPVLQDIAHRKADAFASARTDCKGAVPCIAKAMILSDADVEAAGEVLARVAKPGGALNALARVRMRDSGAFSRHAALDDAGLMRAAWRETATGINRLYRVYALGEAPRYPNSDSMLYNPDDVLFGRIVTAFLDVEADRQKPDLPFFAIWSNAALDLLTANQRDEAIRYEPLASGENRKALARASNLAWSRWPYAAILVPGSGLQEGEQRLSAIGTARLALAVERYRRGLAPFVIVSGGHVHPNRTIYNEAIEMKRMLVTRYAIPEDAIFIDPYARHTTTNLRNAARLLFYAGAPAGMPALVVSDRTQSATLEGEGFVDRCRRELGYPCLDKVIRIAPTDVAVHFNRTSLHIDPSDPLDP